VCRRLADAGIRVSLFVDPDAAQLEAAVRIGAPAVELHTGSYADARGEQQARELQRISAAARHASSLGLIVHAGHGMNYHNVQPIAAIREIVELNIGHAIVARSLIDGMARAVAEMKRLMVEARAATGA
jgi:pyridoxine 5-phosphate synthase